MKAPKAKAATSKGKESLLTRKRKNQDPPPIEPETVSAKKRKGKKRQIMEVAQTAQSSGKKRRGK